VLLFYKKRYRIPPATARQKGVNITDCNTAKSKVLI
jgi:hypothetical protein